MGCQLVKGDKNGDIQIDQYICLECGLIPEITMIDTDNKEIIYKCPKDGEKKIKIKDYFEKEKQYFNYSCKCCQKLQENDFNNIFDYCTICKEIYCSTCRQKHEHETSFLKMNEINYKCHTHLEEYKQYCTICKKHFCENCDACTHENERKDLITPNINEIDILKRKIEFEENLIKLLKTVIDTYEKHPSNYFHSKNITNIINNDKYEILSAKLKLLETKIINYFNSKFTLNIEQLSKNINFEGKQLESYELNLLSGVEFNSLEKLSFKNTKLKNIEPIKDFKIPNLKDIDLSSNEITNITPFENFLDNNKEIRHIKLNKNKINNIDVFKNNNFPKLKLIELNDNKIIQKDLDEIKKLINKNNECKLKYKVNNSEGNHFFGETFIHNNKHLIKLVFNGEEMAYDKFEKLNKNNNENDIIDINLLINKDVTDLSCFFQDCSSLISIDGIADWNTCDMKNFSNFFKGCSSLETIPDISNWNTSEVEDMSYMFNRCSSLEALPDISKWNTHKVKDMQYMFAGCSKLKELPDITKWDISKVVNINNIFSDTPLLKDKPDLTQLNLHMSIRRSFIQINND